MRTALQIMQDFCRRSALPVPTNITANIDPQVVQLLALMNEELDDLTVRYDWSDLTERATFNATGVESQGAIETLAPGYRKIIKNTMWSNTRRLRAVGSISTQDTEFLKVFTIKSAPAKYELAKGLLNFIPSGAIPVGEAFSFRYLSRYGVIDTDGVTSKQYFVNDGDTPKLPDALILLGLRWRWRMQKGLEYSEQYATYENRVAQAFYDTKDKRAIQMNQGDGDQKPSILIPPGNWP